MIASCSRAVLALLLLAILDPNTLWAFQIAQSPDGMLFVSHCPITGPGNNAFYRSSDNGVTWIRPGPGFVSSSTQNVVTIGVSTDAVLYASAFGTPWNADGSPSYNLYRSTDNGDTWTPITNLHRLVSSFLALPGGAILAATSESYNPTVKNQGNIFRSTDRGKTWSPLLRDARRSYGTLIRTTSGNILSAVQTFLVAPILSADNGSRWKSTLGRNQGNPWYIAAGENGVAVAANYRYGILYSTTNGAKWKTIVPARTITDATPLAVAPDGSFYTTGYFSEQTTLYHYTFDSKVWTKTALTPLPIAPDQILVCAGALLAYNHAGTTFCRSTDDGATWTIATLQTNSPAGRAALTSHNSLPMEYSLGQNYPNPFNPLTTIPFSLAEESPVSLIVYDLSGKEVGRLLNGEVLPQGTHTAVFNAASLASGSYIYKLTTGNYSAYRKMQSIK